MELEFHPIANCWPLIEGKDFDGMVADIAENGLIVPIVLYEDKILDGRNRYRACLQSGVTPYFVAYGPNTDSRIQWERWEGGDFGRETRGTLIISDETEYSDYDDEIEFIEAEYKGDIEDPIAFAKSLNDSRRHQNESQRAMTAAKLATLPKGSNQHTHTCVSIPTQEQAAEMMDVGVRSVQNARVVLEKGSDELKHAVETGAVSVRAAVEVAKLDKEEQALIVEAGPDTVKEVAKDIRENGIVNRTSFTGNNQWFTPTDHIERARLVLGTIDLDPASHEIAQQNVMAGNFFTEENSGLDKEWFGNVWLNPPYAQPDIGYFVDKMVEEVGSGRVTQAIMLTHNYTDTAWFQKAARACRAICFTRGRVRFVSPTGELAAPTQGQAFFYFGDNVEAFSTQFSEVGFVVARI